MPSPPVRDERVATSTGTAHPRGVPAAAGAPHVAQVEWFDRKNLYARFAENTRNGEEVYNLDLQRFLFLDGGYITQAKARSASGEADLIGGLETDDALICEGKLYDSDSRGKSYLAKGFH